MEIIGLKLHRLSIFLLLLILTAGAVCAADENQTVQDPMETPNQDSVETPDQNPLEAPSQDAQETTEDDIVSGGFAKSFYDLNEDISQIGDAITLESDYRYRDNNDVKYIKTDKNFTINGNNCVLDGNGKTRVFMFYNNTVSINNLVFRNCNESAIVLLNCELFLHDVTFENNVAKESGGAINAQLSKITCENVRFTDNYAAYGASVNLYDSVLNITNSVFECRNPICWAMVYGYSSEINITDCVFANATSKYATAIHSNHKANVKKSKFINLTADRTAGAIAFKGSYYDCAFEIEDCEFINIASYKNGGAVFIDIAGDENYWGYALIRNSSFVNCTSEFGGALLQLGGELTIVDTQFTDNIARANGGAAYISNATVDIRNSTFTDNFAKGSAGCGGALFLDIGEYSIDYSTFAQNHAGEGGAVYAYQSEYQITGCEFTGNGEAIHTVFDRNGSYESANIFNSDKSTLNEEDYSQHIRYGGKQIHLNRLTINGSANDSYFSLRDLGLVTPVKTQGLMGSCWTFGVVGALESAFLIATNMSLDFSESDIMDFGLRYSLYGCTLDTEAGSYSLAASYFVSWIGAYLEDFNPYDELAKISSPIDSLEGYRIQDVLFVDITDRNAIKQALTTYGALDIYVYGADSHNVYYNATTKSSYYYGNESANHYVTLVGWNDTFSRDNFIVAPEGDGAWICKNSWGSEWGDGGYFYISYYDHALVDCMAVGFIIENTETYEKIYQLEFDGYDVFVPAVNDFIEYRNTYRSVGGDLIAAVGTYFDHAGAPYTVRIYVDDEEVYSQSGYSHHVGFNTIGLDRNVAVDANSTFTVEFKSVSLPLASYFRYPIENATSTLLYGDVWEDSKPIGYICCIKAYTYRNPGITENKVKCYSNGETTFSFTDVEANSVTVNFMGKNHTVEIVNGKGNLSLGVLPIGSYMVTVAYNNQTFTNSIVVKTSIDTGDTYLLTVVYNAQFDFVVQFLDVDANPLANREVTVKLDKTDIKGRTDANGTLTLSMPKGIGVGTHQIRYTNPATGENVAVSIKILSRFSANKNVNMYYYDGSSYRVRIVGDDGKFVGKGKVVTVKIGKRTFKVKTDARGYAILRIPSKITPGKYRITATYAGQIVRNTLVVKHVLKTAKTVKVKKSAKRIVLKATLKKGKKPSKTRLSSSR